MLLSSCKNTSESLEELQNTSLQGEYIFPQPFRIFPNVQTCFYDLMGT